MLTIPPEIVHFSHSISVAHETTIKLFTLVHNIDGELLKIDRLLSFYQPRRTGKIRILFDENRHGTVKPMVVRWIKTNSKKRKWRLERLGLKDLPRHRKTQHQFKKYEKEVRKLLLDCCTFINKRRQLLKGLQNYRQAVNNLASGNLERFHQISLRHSELIALLPETEEWERTADDVPDTPTVEHLLKASAVEDDEDDDLLDDE